MAPKPIGQTSCRPSGRRSTRISLGSVIAGASVHHIAATRRGRFPAGASRRIGPRRGGSAEADLERSERWRVRVNRLRSSASGRWGTGWRPARCARGSRPSSGTVRRRRPATSPALGAEVAQSAADAARRAAIVVTMVPDADAVIATARDEGMLAALAPGSIWVQMSTIGVAGIERVAALVEQERPDITLVDAPVSGSKEPGRARRADHLRVGARRRPRPRHSPLRRARPPDPLGGSGRQRHAREGHQQHVVGVRGRSGRRIGRARSPIGSRHPDDGRRARGGTARVSVAIGQARNAS